MLRILLLATLLYFSNPAQALSIFKSKKKSESETKQPLHINEEFTIQSMVDCPWGKSQIEVVTYIPYGEVFVAVMLQQDELLGPTVKEIHWINEVGKFTSYKAETIKESRLDNMAADFDPANAYDRIHEDKHFVRKIYYFNRNEVISNTYIKSAHFISLLLEKDNATCPIDLRADAKLYQEPNFIIPKIPQNYQPATDNPYAKYEKVPQNAPQTPEVQDPEEGVPWDNIPDLNQNFFEDDGDSDLDF